MSSLKQHLWLTIGCFLLSTPLFANTLTLSCPHKAISFKVELAETPEDQQKGLMFRTHLAADAGMLFLYPKAHAVAMWMKNTPLSLDMIFGDGAGRILAIYEKTTPFSLKTIGPVNGTTQVLEILGGSIEKHKITNACILKLKP